MPELTTETVEVPTTDRPSPPVDADNAVPGDALVEHELLVEDVSIDGMCGVY